jgi:uncharacterized protein YbaR (Trm112 family)
LPASGKIPYGRTWDNATKTLGIDKEKQKIFQRLARLYLTGDYSFNELGPMNGMNCANLHKILCYRCGDVWEQTFTSKRHNIKETIKTEIPRLLPEETIQTHQEEVSDPQFL